MHRFILGNQFIYLETLSSVPRAMYMNCVKYCYVMVRKMYNGTNGFYTFILFACVSILACNFSNILIGQLMPSWCANTCSLIMENDDLFHRFETIKDISIYLVEHLIYYISTHALLKAERPSQTWTLW